MTNLMRQSIIDFVGQTTMGRTDPTGASNLISMLNASPALASQYQEMLNSGALKDIVSESLNGAGAQANSSTGTITFNTNGPVNIDNMSTSSISNMGTMITIAAHEGAHINFSTTNNAAQSDSAFGTQAQNLAASGSGQDYTALMQANQLYHSLDESNSMIAGWNAYVGYIATAMPNASMWDLATNNGYSAYYMTTVPGVGYTLNPNLTFNSDKTLSPTAGNLQAEASNYYYNSAATLAGGVGYANTNADWELSTIIAANGGSSFSVNFQQLGLDPRQILIASNQPGDYPLPRSATITDPSSGTAYTYQNGESGTTMTSTKTIQAGDGGRTVDANNYGSNGEKTSEIQTNYNGGNTSGLPDSVVTITSGMAGTSTDTENYNNGVRTSETVVTVSSDNRSVTTSVDSNGDGRADVITNVVYANDSHTSMDSQVTATYNYDSGTVSVNQINYNPGGSQCTYDSKTETMSTGAVLSEVTGTQTAAGTVLSADVSGTGATVVADNAAVTVNAGAVASISGSGNNVSVGDGASATVNGSSDVLNIGSNSTVTVTGDGNTVNIGGGGDHVTIDHNDANGNRTSEENIVSQTDGQGAVSTTTTTTNYDPSTGVETGHAVGTDDGHGDTSTSTYDGNGNLTSYGWQTEGGASGSNTYGSNGQITNGTWNDGNGNSGSNTYGSNGTLESSSWQTNDGHSGTNNYDQNGNLTSDSWQSPNGTSGTDTYNSDGSRASDTWQSGGSSGSDNYNQDGSVASSSVTTVTTNADGSVTTSTREDNYSTGGGDSYGGGYGGGYGGDYGGGYGGGYGDIYNDISTTTNPDGSSVQVISTNQYGYGDTTTTVTLADGSYNTTETTAMGITWETSYNATTGEYDHSTIYNDGSRVDTQQQADGTTTTTNYDTDGSMQRREVMDGSTTTTTYGDGTVTVDQRLGDNNHLIDTTNPDGSHSETRTSNEGSDSITDNYDASGRLTSEDGYNASIPSDYTSSGTISSRWETTYNSDGSSSTHEVEMAGNGQITHDTETDSDGRTASTTTTIEVNGVSDQTTRNADGSSSTAHWDDNGNYHSTDYDPEGHITQDVTRSSDGSYSDVSYDPANGNTTTNGYDASTGTYSTLEESRDANGAYRDIETDTHADGSTQTTEIDTINGISLTHITGSDGTDQYEIGSYNITVDQYDQYWQDYFAGDGASNDPGAGDPGTGDPGASDGSSSTPDMAAGGTDQQAAA